MKHLTGFYCVFPGQKPLFDALGYIEIWGIVHHESEFEIPGAGLDLLFGIDDNRS